MDFVIVCYNSTNAHDAWMRFIREYKKDDNIQIKTHNRNCEFSVELDGKDTYYFLSDYIYSKWCKGRTYAMGTKVYHSGYVVRDFIEYSNSVDDVLKEVEK